VAFCVTDRSATFVFLFKPSAEVDAVVFLIQARARVPRLGRIQQSHDRERPGAGELGHPALVVLGCALGDI
jgi:hypothetical protein